MEENIDLDNDDICGVCYAEFLDIDDLKLHIIQYHLNESSKYRFCNFCSRIFRDIEAYALHLRNAHLRSFRTCKYCTRVFIDSHSLSRHEKKKKHKSSVYFPKFTCSNCIKVFKNKKDLEIHEYDKHRDSEDGVMLQHCFPELSSLININIRKYFKGLHENYIYKCVVCELSTENNSEYIDHLLTKDCKSSSCNTCCNVYPWKSRLEHHCKTHKNSDIETNNGQKQCPKCDKYFHFTKLKSHFKECSTMKCIPCNISFDSIDNFAHHVTTHSHPSPVPIKACKYCRRPFIGMNAMKKHMDRSHKHNLHLYKYKCIYCDIVFKHPKLLFGHFFSKHIDLKPYTCRICDMDFRVRKNFTVHIKLIHKSVGFVEFNSNYHVFFTDKKSENPFQPRNPEIAEPTNNDSDVMVIDDEEIDVETIQKKDSNKIKSLQGSNKDSDKIECIVNVNDDDLKDKNIKVNEDPNNETSINDKNLDLKEKTNENLDTPEDKVRGDGKLKTNEDRIEDKEVSVKLVNVNSDFMTVTETEADQTENEVKRGRRVLKRKIIQPVRSRKRPKTKKSADDPSSDDSDVPLSKIVNKKPKRTRNRRIKRKKNFKETTQKSRKKMKFICFKCERNCYTYQNYHRHISLHMKNSQKTCVKCYEKFKSKDKLYNHMKTEHSTSKLTETLKMLLDKRKSEREVKDVTINKPATSDNTISKTLQKVPTEVNDTQATITRVEDKLSVKKFLETFKPDANDPTAKISISNITIRPVANGEPKMNIKMTKSNPEAAVILRPQLKMPVKFREESRQEHKVTIKLVYCDNVAPTLKFGCEVSNGDIGKIDSYFDKSDDVQNKNEIPEVGREVLLGDKDTGKVVKKTIVLKDLLSYNNVRIGHLAPKAPFYKIVKIDDVLNDKVENESPKPINITLPNGTKLVSVNPLAHLLGNKNVADLPKSNPYKNKPYSYKPKVQDVGEAIVKAMKILDKAPARRKSTKKIDSVN